MRLNFENSDTVFGADKSRLINSIFSRSGMEYSKRILVSIAVLQTKPDTSELNNLLSILEFEDSEIPPLYEVFLQGYLFCGFPRAIESLNCFCELLKFKGIALSNLIVGPQIVDYELLYKRGLDLSRQIHQTKFELIIDRINEISPDLGFLMITEGYGRILHRSQLDITTRELAIIGSLTAQQANRQLDSHIRGARNAGCDDLEVYEAIITAGAWVNPIIVEESLLLWKKITGKEITDSFSSFIV